MNEVILQARLWYWQRISAMVLAVFVLVHLGVIIYAMHGGLSAAQILGRTQGNPWVALFYLVFVLACTVHVPIGLTRIAREWWSWPPGASSAAAALFAAFILVVGCCAVYGVYAA